MLLADLAVSTLLFPADTPITDVELAFLRHDTLDTVLVAGERGSQDIGVVDRGIFLTFLGGRLGYGRAIYARKTLTAFDAPPALIVESSVSAADAAVLAISRGPEHWADAIAVPLREGFAVVAAATLFKHVTDELGAQLEVDHLTGLLNRRGFLRRLEMASRQTDSDSKLLLLLDLDGFKLVNDALGHQVGDDLLCSTARRISRAVPGAAVARIGGDEFAVLVDMEQGSSADEVGLALVQRLGLATRIAGTEVTVPASVGLATVVRGLGVQELMQRADLALYRAKGAGRNCYHLFDEGINRDAERQLVLSQELRKAIESQQLELHYQPIVDMNTRYVVAYEALARWKSPSAGRVAPDEFIGLAERTGLIVPLGRELLSQALHRLAADGPATVKIHVNISRRELQQPDLVRAVKLLLAESGIEPTRLVIEVTETSVAVDPKRMIGTLHELSQIGVRIALDDFGAGATSLSNLWHFPLDIVKLDLTLVAPLVASGLEGSTGHARVQAIVELCHAHDLVVTAEGVEHPDQAGALHNIGCDYAQGWYFGRPAPDMTEHRRGAVDLLV